MDAQKLTVCPKWIEDGFALVNAFEAMREALLDAPTLPHTDQLMTRVLYVLNHNGYGAFADTLCALNVWTTGKARTALALADKVSGDAAATKER